MLSCLQEKIEKQLNSSNTTLQDKTQNSSKLEQLIVCVQNKIEQQTSQMTKIEEQMKQNESEHYIVNLLKSIGKLSYDPVTDTYTIN